MSSQSTNKKRKRAASPERLTFSTASASVTHGRNVPVLLSFPAVEAPLDTAFKCYAQKKSKRAKEKEKEKEDAGPSSSGMIVVGETEDMEFFSNETENRDVEKSGCKYMIAVHNKQDGSLKLLPATAPIHILKQKVKALKSVAAAAAPSALAYYEARTALGESFGTKKAKANIRAQERNKVDISAMENVMEYVMDGIEKGAKDLPTQEEAKTVADSNRLVPPYNETTSDPGDIYPLEGIIPDNEFKAISLSPFTQTQDFKERRAFFPGRSDWVNAHVKSFQGAQIKGSKRKIKLVYYVSVMLAFRKEISRREIDRAQVEDRLKGVPAVIVEGLFSRFTEFARGSSEYKKTSATETKLLAYTLALCLKADGFASDPTYLSQDLGMPTPKVKDIFKSLGCTFKKLGDNERAKLGYGNESANTSMAVLTAPVKFPAPPRKKSRK